MILTSNFQEHAKDFFDDNATCDSLIQVATEVRDCIEIAHTSEYKKFLHFYFPAFEHVLRKRTKPQFVANKENKLRNSVVEILHRLPQNQTLKEHVPHYLVELKRQWERDFGVVAPALTGDVLHSLKQ